MFLVYNNRPHTLGCERFRLMTQLVYDSSIVIRIEASQ